MTDDFFEEETEAREHADAQVSETQAALKPGDFCMRRIANFIIYSEILDPAAMILAGRKIEDLDEDELSEYEYTRDLYREPHMKNYRFTRSYSVACPNGELGDVHVSVVTPITAAQFNAAKTALTKR